MAQLSCKCCKPDDLGLQHVWEKWLLPKFPALGHACPIASPHPIGFPKNTPKLVHKYTPPVKVQSPGLLLDATLQGDNEFYQTCQDGAWCVNIRRLVTTLLPGDECKQMQTAQCYPVHSDLCTQARLCFFFGGQQRRRQVWCLCCQPLQSAFFFIYSRQDNQVGGGPRVQNPPWEQKASRRKPRKPARKWNPSSQPRLRVNINIFKLYHEYLSTELRDVIFIHVIALPMLSPVGLGSFNQI